MEAAHLFKHREYGSLILLWNRALQKCADRLFVGLYVRRKPKRSPHETIEVVSGT